VLGLSPIFLQYGLFLVVFSVLGFSSDNSVLNSQVVNLLPTRPPKPRGFYRKRRRHRHYFRRIRFLATTVLSLVAFPNPSGVTGYAPVTPFESTQLNRDLLARTRHKFLHLSWINIDLEFDVNFSKFIRSIDPLRDFHLHKRVTSMDFLQSLSSASSLSCFATSPSTPESLFNVLLQDTSPSSETPSVTPPFDMPVVLDTGSSITLTPILSDFVGPLVPTALTELKGLKSKTHVVGQGVIEWPIRDYWNVPGIIRTTAFYVPNASIRLFSPQSYFQEHKNQGRCVIEGRKATLELHDNTVLEFPYNPGNNLPLMLLDELPQVGIGRADINFFASNLLNLLSVTDQTNQNLKPAQKELLLLHFKLGHAGFKWCQQLCRVPHDPLREQVIVPKFPTITTCTLPLCTACQLSKQNRCTPPLPVQHSNPTPTLRLEDLQPGDCISIDQYLSSQPGRLPHTKGKEKPIDQFHGGTIFVDHASGFIFLRNQVSLNAGETLRSKKAFEQFASTVGVSLKKFHADNVPFNSKEFRRNLELNGQPIAFSGTGAHHQNGVAERAIQTVTRWARAMLLHSIILWPDQADLALWPFALDHAVFLWNNIPSQTSSLAPIEVFTKTRFPNYNHLRRLHVWGCPVYVLDPKLQDGHKIPKWQP
jgi:hypothetical protein